MIVFALLLSLTLPLVATPQEGVDRNQSWLASSVCWVKKNRRAVGSVVVVGALTTARVLVSQRAAQNAIAVAKQPATFRFDNQLAPPLISSTPVPLRYDCFVPTNANLASLSPQQLRLIKKHCHFLPCELPEHRNDNHTRSVHIFKDGAAQHSASRCYSANNQLIRQLGDEECGRLITRIILTTAPCAT